MIRTRFLVLPCVIVALICPAISESSGPMSPEINVSDWDMHEMMPDVAYNSNRDEYFVVWDDSNGIAMSVKGQRHSSTGEFLGEYVIAYEADPARDNWKPSVAYDPVNDRYLVVWVHDYYGNFSDVDIWGRLVPWDGPSASFQPFPINGAGENQWDPRVAYGGTVQEFMVTWWNDPPAGSARNISAQRISAAGAAQGGVIAVTSHATEDRVEPDIAYNQARNEFIIVYEKQEAAGGDIYGVRLSGTGGILGGGDFPIAAWIDPETWPRISASRVGNVWAVVWQSLVDPVDTDVYARLVSVNGTGAVELSPPKVIQSTLGDNARPDVSAFPESSTFMIVSQEPFLSGHAGIACRTLDASNRLGPIYDVRGAVDNDSSLPAVVGGENGWMMVWQQERAPSSYYDIKGRIFFTDIMADGFESSDTTGWSQTVP